MALQNMCSGMSTIVVMPEAKEQTDLCTSSGIELSMSESCSSLRSHSGHYFHSFGSPGFVYWSVLYSVHYCIYFGFRSFDAFSETFSIVFLFVLNIISPTLNVFFIHKGFLHKIPAY